MTYFVADDLAHLRQGSAGFVSRCGYVYPSVAVDWAGDYEPEAYDVCDECGSQAVSPDTSPQDGIVVQGVYAVEDDAHLWVRHSEGRWHSVCGRDDANYVVAWAGDEWPLAYDACSKCLEVVDDDLWQPQEPGDELTEPTDEDRYRAYRVWVIQDGVEHRAGDHALTSTMCGTDLRAGVKPHFAQAGGATHCHVCDHAVGRARAGLPFKHPVKQTKIRPSKGQASKGKPPTLAAHRPSKHSAPARKAKGRGQSSSADKEIALFGRRMIVPIRLFHGGAPGLGRRR